jgi:hypothetical protein
MALTYIGCGTDFSILPLFPTIKLFIYIDSLPSSAYGLLFYDDKSMYDYSYLNTFAKTIPKQFTKISFKNEYPDVYYNHMAGQTLVHAYDLPYPLPTTQTQTSTIITTDDINNINKLVANTTHLLVKGYHPPVSIFTHIHTKKITVITDCNTWYPSHKSKLDDEDKDKVPTHLLFNTNNIRNRISDIIYIDNTNNMHTYTNYDDFLLHML